MSSMQIVFLFDLNAFFDDQVKSVEELQTKLLCLRLACLRILTHYSTAISNLKWGFKFFDSRGSFTQIMNSFSFTNISLESFETLENEICLKYLRHLSYLEALALSTERNQASSSEEPVLYNEKEIKRSPVQVLHLALTQILCEYQWTNSVDMFSPSTKKHTYKNIKKRNLLFLISKCSSSADEFQKYFGLDFTSIKAANFPKLLLPQSLQEQLLEKASILWIWLNTLDNESFLGNPLPDILTLMADSLKSLQCGFVPLRTLSQPNYAVKLETIQKEQQSNRFDSDVSYSSLIPFSRVISQSLSHPFYNSSQKTMEEIELCFSENDVRISITVTNVPLLWNKKNYSMFPKRIKNQTGSENSLFEEGNGITIPKSWKTFTAHFSVARYVQLKSYNMLLCLPNVSTSFSSYCDFQMLIKSLFKRNDNLFVTCESACGITIPGVLTPLSDTSAVISLLNPNIIFINKTNTPFDQSKSSQAFNISELKRKLVAEAENSELNAFTKQLNDKPNQLLKPFEVECVESWFVPTSSAFNAFSKIQLQLIGNSEVEAFHTKLQQSKNLKKFKKKSLKNEKIEASETEACTEALNYHEDYEQICKDLSYDQLIALLTDTYAIAVKSYGSVLHSAKKIIKVASLFFLKQSIIKYEENMKNFMGEYFFTTGRKLIQKYETEKDDEAALKLTNESKLQTILALEMEMLFPSVGETSCVDSVKTLLGIMSFHCGATSLLKYLQDELMENYGNKLYDMLIEIGEELGISLNPVDDSPGETIKGTSPGSVTDILNSVPSTLSSKSSSSTSSKSDGRKLIRKRSDLSDVTKSRHILLPGKSPKKKKSRNSFAAENIPMRYSPRLASKKRNKSKTVEIDKKNVRRNLFVDKKIQTPRTSKVLRGSPFKKKKVKTPKGHHVLKTNFVPNTPLHKQNQSALQRRKSQIGIDAGSCEIAESPTVLKNAKDKNKLRMLQQLKDQSQPSTSSTQPAIEHKNSPKQSFSQYTPDSKRRLSLKLFSKLLASPTARMGLKKCSKRLFDQVSQPTCSVPCKRIKLCDSFENIPDIENSDNLGAESKEFNINKSPEHC